MLLGFVSVRFLRCTVWQQLIGRLRNAGSSGQDQSFWGAISPKNLDVQYQLAVPHAFYQLAFAWSSSSSISFPPTHFTFFNIYDPLGFTLF